VSEPPDIRNLVGDDIPAEELERIERVDNLLRSVPPPPAVVPDSLTRAVRGLTLRTRSRRPRRLAIALPLAAALAGLFFGLGRWTAGGEELDPVAAIRLQATDNAPGAWGLIEVGPRERRSGNYKLIIEVAGLPKLDGNGYYDLWLARNGRYAATCGTFNVGSGTTTVELTVSYRLEDYDRWVITEGGVEEPPWLLSARVAT
jgi:hypothetical protein